MASSFEKSVKGGTKIKLAAPKSKYVEHILIATHAGEAAVGEVFRALQNRLRDSTWTIVFKALIIVHLMIREGEPDVTLRYLADGGPRKLAISNFSDVQIQGSNIRHYAQYLLERARSFKETKVDFVRRGEGRLKRLTVDKGLLRETESVQNQIQALLKCDILSNEPENEITLTAFRLLTMDLLALFHVMNEGTINVLEHYFEMSKYDAERALNIYVTFSKQTNQVVDYLGVARRYETATRLEIPKLKHAPTGLTASLEDYLNDPDFEINRRQYLAQQEAKKGQSVANGAKKLPNESKPMPPKPTTTQKFPSPKSTEALPIKQEAIGPAPDLIDFFASIEEKQQPMANQQQQQQQLQVPQYQQTQPFQQQQNTGFVPQQQPYISPPNQPSQMNDPAFGPPQNSVSFTQPLQQQPALQSDFSASVFNALPPNAQTGYNIQQSTQTGFVQDTNAGFHQQQPTNPFRQPTVPSNSTVSSQPQSNPPFVASTVNRQPTNPFARNLAAQQTGSNTASPFQSPPPGQPFQRPQQQYSAPSDVQPLRPTATGTNPFARNTSPEQQGQPTVTASQQPIAPNPTGSTNPFRQSTFHNNQTGQGWQSGQGTLGGLEQLDTVPIFPRPGQPFPGQQQQPQGWSGY
ncbi:MAG: hypothetical protein M1836_000845 [Candelina mexicana]|nr:MAG: hypothetical protein M1836_000845 [Candelina mexicana]